MCRASNTTQVTKDLKPIYTAINPDQAMLALEQFEAKWPELAIVGRMWREALAARDPVHGLRARSPARDLHHQRDRGAQPAAAQSDQDQGQLPHEEAAIKLLYLAIHNAVPQWTRTRGWTKAMLAFKIQFGDRLPD